MPAPSLSTLSHNCEPQHNPIQEPPLVQYQAVLPPRSLHQHHLPNLIFRHAFYICELSHLFQAQSILGVARPSPILACPSQAQAWLLIVKVAAQTMLVFVGYLLGYCFFHILFYFENGLCNTRLSFSLSLFWTSLWSNNSMFLPS